MIAIRPDDLSGSAIRALLELHFAAMLGNSPAGHCHFLDFDGLRQPDVDFWSAWDGDTLLGCGALKALGDGTGEIKSMRTHPDHLRKGAAAAMLAHIVAEGQALGYRRLSLETGSGDAFEPALALYRRNGFVDGAPFGDYRATDFNIFLHREL